MNLRNHKISGRIRRGGFYNQSVSESSPLSSDSYLVNFNQRLYAGY